MSKKDNDSRKKIKKDREKVFRGIDSHISMAAIILHNVSGEPEPGMFLNSDLSIDCKTARYNLNSIEDVVFSVDAWEKRERKQLHETKKFLKKEFKALKAGPWKEDGK